LAKQLNAGIDPHLGFAAKLLQIDYEDAVARKKAGDAKIAVWVPILLELMQRAMALI
jgi:hypothetical protein